MPQRDKSLFAKIEETIEGGHSVSDSFLQTKAFPAFFTALIRVGEISGTLPEQLQLASDCYQKEEEFIARLKTALFYPAFVLLFACVVFTLILTVILPSFAMLFEALAIPLPVMTRLALAFGGFLQRYGLALSVCLVVLSASCILYFKSPMGKENGDRLLFASRFIRRLLLIRFAFALSALLKSGKPLSLALSDIADMMDNGEAKKEISRISREIEQGGHFAECIRTSSFTEHSLSRMVRVGMESGRLPLFLEHSARLMTEETERKLLRLRKILEPALILFVGLLTAAVVFSVLVPVFQAVGTHMG